MNKDYIYMISNTEPYEWAIIEGVYSTIEKAIDSIFSLGEILRVTKDANDEYELTPITREEVEKYPFSFLLTPADEEAREHYSFLKIKREKLDDETLLGFMGEDEYI